MRQLRSNCSGFPDLWVALKPKIFRGSKQAEATTVAAETEAAAAAEEKFLPYRLWCSSVGYEASYILPSRIIPKYLSVVCARVYLNI